MNYKLKNITIDGKYQKLWFRWFDLLCTLGFTIVLGNNLTIKNFNFDFNELKKGTGSYCFAIAVKQLSEQEGAFEVDLKTGKITIC